MVAEEGTAALLVVEAKPILAAANRAGPVHIPQEVMRYPERGEYLPPLTSELYGKRFPVSHDRYPVHVRS